MRRTTDPPKTNITLFAVSLATGAFVIWLANLVARPDSIYADAARQPLASRPLRSRRPGARPAGHDA
jgi:hypothetical protein